jgi:predicted nucleic acid-binding protein
MIVGIDTDFLVRLSILEHPENHATRDLRDRHMDAGGRFALAPQVLSEFTHVVTDPRRFETPLPMQTALQLAQQWWNAAEIDHIHPTAAAVEQFFSWMTLHHLGRKRILDTMLAATCVSAGVTHLITGNPGDYQVFSELQLIEMRPGAASIL